MNKTMDTWKRVALATCAIALVVVLFVPLWTIDLVAPQYPEGLVLVINPDGLAGNVDIINGLNHYIGMKTLHNADFPEFRILPYIIGTFAMLFLVAAVIGKPKFFYAITTLYILFGIVAMIDFYHWEYNYGHDLDPHAAIQVPGMAYQPPLIGYKQLLNFSAYSLPAAGGWIFIIVGVLSVVLAFIETRKAKLFKGTMRTLNAALASMLLFCLSSCSTEPKPINFGTDNCHFCKMAITDNRFGAEVVTKKGKVYKFDDTHCMFAFMKADETVKAQVSGSYVIDFATSKLIAAESALLLRSSALKSPMGGNVAAFSSQEMLQQVHAKYEGSIITWNELSK